jgi:hypothetical protein
VLTAVVWAAALIVYVVGSEYVRVRIRRPILQRWIEEQGLTLRSSRYTVKLFRPYAYFRWIVPFKIEVVDKTGHVTPGLLWVSGFIRRQCWVDWGRTERLH